MKQFLQDYLSYLYDERDLMSIRHLACEGLESAALLLRIRWYGVKISVVEAILGEEK